MQNISNKQQTWCSVQLFSTYVQKTRHPFLSVTVILKFSLECSLPSSGKNGIHRLHDILQQ
jgi:hypothetical protein